jgi:hypothetical protein
VHHVVLVMKIKCYIMCFHVTRNPYCVGDIMSWKGGIVQFTDTIALQRYYWWTECCVVMRLDCINFVGGTYETFFFQFSFLTLLM